MFSVAFGAEAHYAADDLAQPLADRNEGLHSLTAVAFADFVLFHVPHTPQAGFVGLGFDQDRVVKPSPAPVGFAVVAGHVRVLRTSLKLALLDIRNRCGLLPSFGSDHSGFDRGSDY